MYDLAQIRLGVIWSGCNSLYSGLEEELVDQSVIEDCSGSRVCTNSIGDTKGHHQLDSD
jgi:hypothetical protein